MQTYSVQGMIPRPTFLHLEVEADSPAAAEDRAIELIEGHLGLKYIEDFEELIGLSEGTFDGVEILSVEVSE